MLLRGFDTRDRGSPTFGALRIEILGKLAGALGESAPMTIPKIQDGSLLNRGYCRRLSFSDEGTATLHSFNSAGYPLTELGQLFRLGQQN